MLSRRHVIAGLAAPLAACDARTASQDIIEVSASPGAITGTLRFGSLSFACALGRSGISRSKHEGDGATPAGTYPLREVCYRLDRLPSRPQTGLPIIATRPADGWCDDPADPAYNKPVQLPYPRSAEQLWREDGLYDVLAVIGYNDAPPVAGAGSAIFLHVMRPDGGPTSGCVALKLENLLTVLARCHPGTMIRIG